MSREKKTTLVFSGASSKIPIHLGAYRAVLEADYEIFSTYGSSAGAIIAALISDERSYGEIESLVYEVGFKELVKTGPIEYMLNVYFSHGLVRGKRISDLLKKVFGKKTLKEVKIPLNIIVHSMKSRSWLVLNQITAPDIPVFFALRASCSIPILFNPVKFGEDLWVDAGMSKGFAVDLVEPGNFYIGHCIENESSPDFENMSFKKYVATVFEQLVNDNVYESIRNAHEEGVISKTLYSKSISDFDVSREEKSQMIGLGFRTTSRAIREYEEKLAG